MGPLTSEATAMSTLTQPLPYPVFFILFIYITTKLSENDPRNESLYNIFPMGCGGGLVVSVLAFYSDDPSSIPAEVYNFSVKLLLKRTKINKKRPGLAQFFLKKKKKNIFPIIPKIFEIKPNHL